MTKVSNWHKKQRLAKVKVITKEEKKRIDELNDICKRAKARRKDPKEKENAKLFFKTSYFNSLRNGRNNSNKYPSLNENIPNPAATAQRGIMSLKVKLNAMDEDTRAREEKAISEAEARNKSVAPICNKGGYQLISKDSLHTIGRKI